MSIEKNANSWEEVARINADSTTYTDTSIEDGSSYLYRVAPFNLAGVSPFMQSESLLIEKPKSEGESLLETHCSACHVDGGLAVELLDPFLAANWEDKTLSEFVSKVSTMPLSACDTECVNAVADYIWLTAWGFEGEGELSDEAAGVRGLRKLTPKEIKNK